VTNLKSNQSQIYNVRFKLDILFTGYSCDFPRLTIFKIQSQNF